VNAQRYQVGKAGLIKLFGLIGHNLTVPTDLLKSDGKSLVPNLPEMRGNYGGQNGNATGLNAKLYRLSYVVNG